eukprot:g11531.t1 g11531   contig6:10689-11099(+)
MKRERELVKQQQGGEERSDCSNANTTTSTLRPPPPPPLLPPDSETDCKEEEYARDKLAELTQAYESDDLTRLLYHRYGIVDGPEDVVRLLNGRMRMDMTMKKLSINCWGGSNEWIEQRFFFIVRTRKIDGTHGLSN